MTALDLLLLGLAVWYLQQVLRWETGPFGVFDWVREHVFGVRVDDFNDRPSMLPVRPGTLADLVMCIYCSSFWAALVLLLLWWLWPPSIWPLALAGAAVVISKAVTHGTG